MTRAELKTELARVEREILRREGWYSADSETIHKILITQVKIIQYLIEPPSKEK